MPNTNITPPRVALVDDRGMITREWYRFLLSLFTLTGGGQSDTTLTDVQLVPLRSAIDELLWSMLTAGDTSPAVLDLSPIYQALADLAVTPPQPDLAPVMQTLQDLMLEPTAAPSGPTAPIIYTVADLPTNQQTMTRAAVSDANATTFASVVAGGGANIVPVYYDGTSWRIG